ncbi:MAG TPA: glycosyltransferase family 39 protein [Devosia sp.]|nr:glycosyltransferase family 39 protein [Devosia sp.]
MTRGNRQWLGPEFVAAAVVVLLTALRLYLASKTGLSHDEAYYTFWSKSLSAGYFDHPPMVALLIAPSRAIFGDNELGARFLAVMCLVLTSAAVWRIADLLLDRSTAALAVVLYNLAPAQIGFVVTPDAPSVLFWVGGLWAAAEFMRSRRAGWWLVAGLSAGLGLWSKYTDALLPLGLLLFLLANSERRRWLTLWQVWAGAALGVIVFLPVIVWNWQHDWASFRFQGGRLSADAIDPAFLWHFVELFGGFVVTLGPVVAVAAFVGLTACLIFPGDGFWRRVTMPVWTSLPLLGYFVLHSLHGGVQPNWPLPVSTALVVIAAWALIGLWRRIAWLAGLLIALQVLIGITAITILSVQLLWQPFDLGGNDRSNEMRDWRGLVSEIDAVARDNDAKWIATSHDYALTGELASYALFLGSSLPVRQIDEPERWVFLPALPAEIASAPAIFVSGRADVPTQFASAQLIKTVQRSDVRRAFATYWLFLVSVAAGGPTAN